MSRFFVGQRVKKVRGVANVGLTGRVTDIEGDVLLIEVDAPFTGRYGWESTSRMFDAGEQASWPSNLWEPILPDGHRAGDFTNVQDLLDSLTREHA